VNGEPTMVGLGQRRELAAAEGGVDAVPCPQSWTGVHIDVPSPRLVGGSGRRGQG
jgi:hypothetical protein